MNQTDLPPIVSIVGRPKVGKTTFLVKLIAELTNRGYRIGVIKHSVHPFDVAQPGKDTWKHAQAGAVAVAFASPQELVLSRRLDREQDIQEIALLLGPVDLILTEGYRRAHQPKIEISRRELGTGLVGRSQEIIAVVSDHPVELSVPRFDLEDACGVASYLEERYLCRPISP
jgi:molybdopterin-guanine dinucleotide biosynthesis protein B